MINLSIIELLVVVLAVWRVTHFVTDEDGPFDIVVKFRKQFGQGFIGTLLDCFYCLSIWVAVPFAFVIGNTWIEGIILWLAFSGGACLLYKSTEKR